jgi:hypothetical protein
MALHSRHRRSPESSITYQGIGRRREQHLIRKRRRKYLKEKDGNDKIDADTPC